MKPGVRFAAVLAVFVAVTGLDIESARAQAPGRKTAKTTDPGSKFADLRGEWRRAGAGFACVVKPPERLPFDKALPDAMARACSFLGRFALGDDPQTVTKALGPPHRSLAQPKGATALVYFLEQAGQLPYFAATVSKNRIVALQISGSAAAKGYDFNHVDLGSSTGTVLQYFGQPSRVEPSGIKDTNLWTWRPWPFSFEVKDDRVTSIRIGVSD